MHLIALTPWLTSPLSTPPLSPPPCIPWWDGNQGKPAPATIWWEVCRLVGVELFHLARLPVPKPLTASDIVRRTCWVLQREADVGRQDEELPGQANQIHWSVCILSCNPWPSSSPRWSPDSSQVEWWVVSRNDFFAGTFTPSCLFAQYSVRFFQLNSQGQTRGEGECGGKTSDLWFFFFSPEFLALPAGCNIHI